MKSTIPVHQDPLVVPRDADNPFRRGPDGHRNVSAIMKLCREDPQRARRLCFAAGENWPDWTGEGRVTMRKV